MIEIDRGRPHPLGSSVGSDGVDFSVFSKSADTVQLALYDHVDDQAPTDL